MEKTDLFETIVVIMCENRARKTADFAVFKQKLRVSAVGGNFLGKYGV